MRQGPLRADVALLREGLALGWRFGLGSLEELARTGWELEHGIYRLGSMERTEVGVRIPLLNPPLRIGAFRGLSASWDGRPVDPERSTARSDRDPTPRSFASVAPEHPLELDVGEGSVYELALPTDPGAERHRVRLSWRSAAVPPLVWVEFADTVRPATRRA